MVQNQDGGVVIGGPAVSVSLHSREECASELIGGASADGSRDFLQARLAEHLPGRIGRFRQGVRVEEDQVVRRQVEGELPVKGFVVKSQRQVSRSLDRVVQEFPLVLRHDTTEAGDGRHCKS